MRHRRQQIDLGDITIEPGANEQMQPKIRRGPIKRTAPAAAAKASHTSEPASGVRVTPKPDAPTSKTPTTLRQVRGRVLLPNGQPAAGATVRAIRTKSGPLTAVGMTVLSELAVDSQGEFQLQVDFGEIIEGRARINLWATLEGYGGCCCIRSRPTGKDRTRSSHERCRGESRFAAVSLISMGGPFPCSAWK